ncbi:MAG: hypothetical protein ABII12_16770 [Planctomycetota bacterium]
MTAMVELVLHVPDYPAVRAKLHPDGAMQSEPMSRTDGMATHWAHVVELVYAAERTLELANDDEIIDPNVRTVPTETPFKGVGSIEAPRCTLIHHYVTDEQGILKRVNLIVGTTNNHAAICVSIKKAAQGVYQEGRRRYRGPAESHRDGFPRIRSVLRMRDPLTARADADDPATSQRSRRSPVGEDAQEQMTRPALGGPKLHLAARPKV